ncbi:hypothetical protein D6D28_05673 [Aureobasidium pullulans]|uniref:Amidoligase enzyme n=1 Tax=Aureobasidium pullulans TaxID=5580 RepID=A0A4S8SGG2_AURPU|nr:hypothetical protein D6D28_05673 [Aureobasidium pullulans]
MTSININDKATSLRTNIEHVDLTFGVELECIGFTPSSSPKSATQLCSEILQQKVLLPCKYKCERGVHEWHLPVREEVVAEKSISTSSFLAWEIQRDTSIRLNDQEQEAVDRTAYNNGAAYSEPDSEFEDIELVSRVLSFDQPTPCPRGQVYPCTKEPFEWQWREEIIAILEALQKGFSKPGYRIMVNGSTGLHVHLGHGPQGFRLDTVKGIVGGFVAFERCLDSIMPVNRILGHMDSKLLYGVYSDDLSTEALTHDFSHQNLQAMSDAMCRHVNTLIDAQFKESAPAGWGLDSAVQAQTLASQDMDSKSIWGINSGWEKVITPDWLDATQGTAAKGSWLDAPQKVFVHEWDGTIPTCPVDPAKASQNIKNLLLSYNIPAWLQMIKDMETLQEIKALGDLHRSSVNLENLHEPDPNVTKNTVEIRVHAGSLDAVEITSWIDLLGSLAHHIESTPSDEWFQYLNTIWAQPKYTLVDLCHRINATEDTVHHYTDVLLTPDYAERRCARYTSGAHNPPDSLNTLTHCIEANRLVLSSTHAVLDCMTQKLASGLYGQFPLAFLRHYIPEASLHKHIAGGLDIEACQEAHLAKAWKFHGERFPNHPSIPKATWWEWVSSKLAKVEIKG